MKIIVERGVVKKLSELPPKSIALDGYVQGPALDLPNQRISFDHHDNCVRTFTRATCQQVFDALRLGFNPKGYTVYVNDIDADTVLSVALLSSATLWARRGMRDVVEAVGTLDAHGPAIAITEDERRLCRIFFNGVMAPEREARNNRTYATIDLEELLGKCLERIPRLLSGDDFDVADNEEKVPFELVYDGGGFIMAKSEGFAFPTLYDEGHDVAVAYNQQKDGSWIYTIAKRSEFIDFPVGPHSKPGTVLHALAQVEPGWGGGSTIGGAPRNPDGSRSKLSPERVFNIICGVIDPASIGVNNPEELVALKDPLLTEAKAFAESEKLKE